MGGRGSKSGGGGGGSGVDVTHNGETTKGRRGGRRGI